MGAFLKRSSEHSAHSAGASVGLVAEGANAASHLYDIGTFAQVRPTWWLGMVLNYFRGSWSFVGQERDQWPDLHIALLQREPVPLGVVGVC